LNQALDKASILHRTSPPPGRNCPGISLRVSGIPDRSEPVQLHPARAVKSVAGIGGVTDRVRRVVQHLLSWRRRPGPRLWPR